MYKYLLILCIFSMHCIFAMEDKSLIIKTDEIKATRITCKDLEKPIKSFILTGNLDLAFVKQANVQPQDKKFVLDVLFDLKREARKYLGNLNVVFKVAVKNAYLKAVDDKQYEKVKYLIDCIDLEPVNEIAPHMSAIETRDIELLKLLLPRISKNYLIIARDHDGYNTKYRRNHIFQKAKIEFDYYLDRFRIGVIRLKGFNDSYSRLKKAANIYQLLKQYGLPGDEGIEQSIQKLSLDYSDAIHDYRNQKKKERD